MAIDNTRHIRNAKRLNDRFWIRLKQLKENTTSIPDAVINEVNAFTTQANDLRDYAPYKYGGLSDSWTVKTENTPAGISVLMHFSNTLHEHKEPGNEYTDKFTNPTLVGWLGGTPNRRCCTRLDGVSSAITYKDI